MQLNKLYSPWAVDNSRWGIEIVEGKYRETVIQIENVEFDETEGNSLKVDYHTINMPDGLIKEDYDTQEFIDIMQVIISDIILTAMNEYKGSDDN